MANEHRLNELQSEVRSLRRELDAARAVIEKLETWCARHWSECHERHIAEQEGH